MAAATYTQSSFLGGEVSKTIQGRFDHPAYRTWMNVCLNGLPMEQGAWTRRPGSRHLWPTRGGAAGRVVTFDFKQSSPYTMEVTAGYLRFRAGPNIVTTNDDQSVVSISTANPAKVATGTHGWSTGNHVIFRITTADNPLLQGRMFAITVTSPTEFTLADAITGESIDGSTLGTFVAATVSRILDIATPYVGDSWSTLRSIQADIPTLNSTTPGAVLLQAGIKPYVLQVETQPTADSFATFSLAAAPFKDGPYFDPVPGGTLATPSALNGIVTITLSFNDYDAARAYAIGDYVTDSSVNYRSLTDANVGNTPASSASDWVEVSAADAIGPNGFQGTDVGRMVRLFSEPEIWDSGATYSDAAVVAFGGSGPRYDNGVTYWKSLQNGNVNKIPGTASTWWTPYAKGARWTWGKITGLSNIIDRALAGSTNFGSMTDGGGNNAAFNGSLSQTAVNSAEQIYLPAIGSFVAGTYTLSSFVGKNYSGATDQVIAQAVVYPSNDRGFGYGYYAPPGSTDLNNPFVLNFVFNLRGKASAPSTASDGTLLGTTGSVPNSAAARTIISNSATAWKYVWIEQVMTVDLPADSARITMANIIGQVSFFAPTGTGTSQGVTVQIYGDPLLYTTPVRTWRLGLYSDTTGWPTAGTYHEGRLWLVGSIGNRFDGSKSNDPFNFAPTNPDGSVSDSNAISYIFNAPDVNPIFWMVPDQLGIVCGTQAGEWLVQATSANLALTPTTIQAHRYTKYNCANIEPRRTDLTLAVVQAFKRELLEYFSDVYSGRFAARDLAEFAKHLVPTGIQEMAYQQETIPVLWARTGGGALIGVTYRRQSLISSQPPDFAGWHRHVLGSGRTVESICTGSNADGTLDALVMVTNDTDTGIRHVEMLTNFFAETDAPAAAWFLDNAVLPTSMSSSEIAAVGAPYGGLTVNGLWHLNGEIVQIWCAGLDLGQGERGTAIADFTVANGSIFIPYGDSVSSGTGGGLFTPTVAAAAVAAGQLVIGFTYTSDGQIVRPNLPAESGARNGPAFGKLRRNQQCMMLVHQTAGLSIGTSFDKLDAVKFNAPGASAAMAFGQTFTGVYREDSVRDSDSFDGMLCWRVTRPWPATISAIGGGIHTKDI